MFGSVKMGHHGRGYGFGSGGHGALGRMPRSLKIVLILAALFILLVGLAVAVLVVLVFVPLVAGGTLQNYAQNAFDFLQRNLQPLLKLLNFLKDLQSLTGN
jgi:flagellar biosynthesis protein FlhB